MIFLKYISAFCELTNTKRSYVNEWLPLVAAARLTKNKGEEKELLNQWINVVDFQKDSSNLWRTGDFQTDSFLKGWRTDYYWNTGTYDGPHEKKDCEV